ncbi:MAG TPA: ATP-grasp ribosomal peptide maturase, partial [Yinghuangia sp.]|nr:ATP-grasp ribosomal peptide maturase [Yinghuangia sp.]
MTHHSHAVWVVTNDDDPTADLVIEELHRRAVPVVRFDSGHFPARLSASARIGGGDGWRGVLRTATREAAIDRVRSLYYRRPSGFAFPHLDAEDARFATTQARYGLGGLIVSLPECLYVNHPNRIGDAEYKPAGLAAAVRAGFELPTTLITNEPAQAQEFARAYGPVLYKPLYAPLYSRAKTSQAVKVAAVRPGELDDAVSGTMHLFQTIIDKVADVRVTVIGGRVFSVVVKSDLLDWRTDYDALAYAVVDTPEHIRAALYAYLDHFQLVFGA